MGLLTRTQIFTEGGLQAGDDTQATRQAFWFNAWLRKQYCMWPWPFLKRRASGISLTTGATTVSVGAGASITEEILRIFEPLVVYTSDSKTRLNAPIIELLMADILYDESSRDSTLGRSTPTQFKCRADATTYGKWSLIPFPVPDKAYLLAFDYQTIPANLSSDSQIPVYPNDRTLIQAAKCAALEYADGTSEALDRDLEVLASMVSDDRDAFGSAPGDNEYWQMDTSVFR